MIEQRHCPRCTMTFRVGEPRFSSGPRSPENCICPVTDCHLRFFAGYDGRRFTTIGVLPKHAERLREGPFKLLGKYDPRLASLP